MTKPDSERPSRAVTPKTPETAKQRQGRFGGLLPWVVLGMASVLVVSLAQIGRGSGEIEDTVSYEYAGGIHTEQRIAYTETPATGGPHHPVWQDCGVYTEELYDEHVVHSLEHGAVAITYDPATLAKTDIDALEERWKTHRYVILSPRSDLVSPIVLTAWNRQLALSEPGDPRIGIFVARYGEGPQAPESGAPCRGGTRRTSTTPWDGAVLGNSMDE